MTTLTYTPATLPSELFANLVDSYWDTKGGNVPKPIIIEKPTPQYQRIDTRNAGDTIVFSMEGFREEYITIAFQHRDLSADVMAQINVFTSRQRFYDYVEEVRRIINSKRFTPTDFLLDGFEGYADSTALDVIWSSAANSTLTLRTDLRKYGTNAMRAVVSGGAGDIYRGFPTYMHGTEAFTLKPYPRRLGQIRFYAKIDSSSDTIGVTLRDASNRSGLYRTWNVSIASTSFIEYRVGLGSTPDASAGTWDPTLIDEIAFTDLANGRTFDFDHINLATMEFQGLLYTGYNEKTDNFQYFQGDLRATFRNVGVPVESLS
ncbi:hypothetical protein [uncultured virus]|uniref:Uncharacterized protein n=1 Tax=uncultured virus TaxID=340016 RepID=A0A218MKY4_9VIRU|nr:hypothetical protein [uncultured virus]